MRNDRAGARQIIEHETGERCTSGITIEKCEMTYPFSANQFFVEESIYRTGSTCAIIIGMRDYIYVLIGHQRRTEIIIVPTYATTDGVVPIVQFRYIEMLINFRLLRCRSFCIRCIGGDTIPIMVSIIVRRNWYCARRNLLRYVRVHHRAVCIGIESDD